MRAFSLANPGFVALLTRDLSGVVTVPGITEETDPRRTRNIDPGLTVVDTSYNNEFSGNHCLIYNSSNNGYYYEQQFENDVPWDVEVHTCTSGNQGISELFIDGQSCGSFSAFSSDFLPARRVARATSIPPGRHTVRVVKLSGSLSVEDALWFLVS